MEVWSEGSSKEMVIPGKVTFQMALVKLRFWHILNRIQDTQTS